MSLGKFLEQYTGQSTDELIALSNEYRIDSLVLAFEQAIQEKQGQLTREERVVLAVEALEREVNNGGYDQFFINSSNEYASEMVDALRRIDCPKTAAATQKAIDAIGLSAPFSVEDIERATASFDDHAALGQCDELYYSSGEDIATRLFDFIKTHHTAIRIGRRP